MASIPPPLRITRRPGGFALVAAAGVRPRCSSSSSEILDGFVSRWKVGRWLKDQPPAHAPPRSLVPDLDLVGAPRARRLRPAERSLGRPRSRSRCLPLRFRRFRGVADRPAVRHTGRRRRRDPHHRRLPKADAFAFAIAAQECHSRRAHWSAPRDLDALHPFPPGLARDRAFPPSITDSLAALSGRGSMTLVFRGPLSSCALAAFALAVQPVRTLRSSRRTTTRAERSPLTCARRRRHRVVRERSACRGTRQRDQQRNDHDRSEPRSPRSRWQELRRATRGAAYDLRSRREEPSARDDLLHEYGHHLDTFWHVPGVPELTALRVVGDRDASLLASNQVAFDYSLGWSHSVGEAREDYAYITRTAVTGSLAEPPDAALQSAMFAELGAPTEPLPAAPECR